MGKVQTGLICLCGLLGLVSATPIERKSADVVVVGSGVGGMTAAIYLARAGLHPIVIEGPTPGGVITLSRQVENWPGELSISGLTLMERLHAQAESNGVSFVSGKVIEANVTTSPCQFTVQDVYDSSVRTLLQSPACILATGASVRMLGVAGEKRYLGKGVYTCAICDGSLYKGQVVAVVGGGDAAVLDAEYLSSLAKKVYVLVRKGQFKGVEKKRQKQLQSLSNVEVVYNVQVQEIVGENDQVVGVDLLSSSGEKSSLPVDAVFVAIGADPNTSLFTSQIDLDSDGYIRVDAHQQTSNPGVFAIGDVVEKDCKQAVCAASDGAKAAIYVQQCLANTWKEQEKLIEVHTLAQLKQLIEDSTIPVFIDFYATWCGPCRHIAPFLERSLPALRGKAVLCKVDVDLARDIAMHYHIRAMPTLLCIDQSGKEIGRKIGPEEVTSYINSWKK